MLTAASCSSASLLAACVAVAPLQVDPVAPARRPYEGPRGIESSPSVSSTPGPGETRPSSPASVEPPSLRLTPELVETSAGSETAGPGPGAEPLSDIRVRPVLDLTITVGAAAPSLALGLWVERGLPNNLPMPGEEADVVAFDEVALGRFEKAPATASDVLLGIGVAAPLVYHAVEAALRRRGWARVRGRGFLVRYGTDLVLYAQALAINALLTEILKASIQRPRPYVFLDPQDVDADQREALMDAQTRYDADWSFPSGHTSTVFTASTAGATLLTLELLGRSRWAIAMAWVGGIGLATTTGAMRVLAGRHFPSDVVTSALIGTGIGAAVPLAHWRPPRAGDRARWRDAARQWVLIPMGGPTVRGVALRGVLP